MIDPRLPRYLKVRDFIAQAITHGEWSPGDAVPTEAQLANMHQVSVGTVRKAMDLLVAEGLIDRVHGKGTFVRRSGFATPLFRFFGHLSQNGTILVPDGRVIDRRRMNPTPEARAGLELKLGQEGVRIKRVRMRDEKIFLVEDIWVSADRFEGILDIDAQEFEPLLYPAYEKYFKTVVVRVEENLCIAHDAGMAKRLGVLDNTMLMEIKRTAFANDGQPVEWRRSYCRAVDFQYRVVVR
ncbi:MAG TPA: GntR family transcriptional regulator [Rhizomicrobium sp.]|jgi:GntR family transcriptional regulator